MLSSNPPLHHVRIFSKRVGRFSLAWPVVAANPRYKKSFIAYLIFCSKDILILRQQWTSFRFIVSAPPYIQQAPAALLGKEEQRRTPRTHDGGFRISHPCAITGIRIYEVKCYEDIKCPLTCYFLSLIYISCLWQIVTSHLRSCRVTCNILKFS